MSSSTPTKQRGFIQGAILVGLALLVLVVAGFSLANRDAAATTGKEQARMNAAVMMKQAADLKDAVYRAYEDKFNPATLIALNGAYIVDYPRPPADTTAGVTPTWSFDLFTTNLAGTSALDTFIAAYPVSNEVCARINAALFGTLVVPVSTDARFDLGVPKMELLAAPWTGRTEGCVPISGGGSNNNAYFKVAVIR